MITYSEAKLSPRTKEVLQAALNGDLKRDLKRHCTFVPAALTPAGTEDQVFDPRVVQICFDYGWLEMPLRVEGQNTLHLRTTHEGNTMLGVRRTNAAGVR